MPSSQWCFHCDPCVESIWRDATPQHHLPTTLAHRFDFLHKHTNLTTSTYLIWTDMKLKVQQIIRIRKFRLACFRQLKFIQIYKGKLVYIGQSARKLRHRNILYPDFHFQQIYLMLGMGLIHENNPRSEKETTSCCKILWKNHLGNDAQGYFAVPFCILSCAAEARFVPGFPASPSLFCCFKENNLIILTNLLDTIKLASKLFTVCV